MLRLFLMPVFSEISSASPPAQNQCALGAAERDLRPASVWLRSRTHNLILPLHCQREINADLVRGFAFAAAKDRSRGKQSTGLFSNTAPIESIYRKKQAIYKCRLLVFGWGRWIRTTGMADSESAALPLGDTPICSVVLQRILLYHTF